MLKKLLKILKKIVIAAFVLYGYNVVMTPLDLMVPINLWTITFVTLLGFPGLFSLVLFLIIVF